MSMKSSLKLIKVSIWSSKSSELSTKLSESSIRSNKLNVRLRS